jgi:hypothetical protein
MYLHVQAQSNPKLSYFEHVRNFSDIFQSINNIIMVVIARSLLLIVWGKTKVVRVYDICKQ